MEKISGNHRRRFAAYGKVKIETEIWASE